MSSAAVFDDYDDDLGPLLASLEGLTPEEIASALEGMPQEIVKQLLALTETRARAVVPESPLAQAQELDKNFQSRPHIEYMSERLTAAVRDVEGGKNRFIRISMPPRSGKQVADREPVLTTKGWKRHGDLRVGDQVFSPAGMPVTVRAVSEPSDEKMKVTFTDGSEILVHPEHEWVVYDRARGAWRTVETQYLAGRALWPRGSRGKRGDRAVVQVPSIEALQMPEAALPIDPYTFGVWLGDGTSSGATICGAQDDLDKILDLIPYELGARWVHKDTGVHYQYVKGGLLGDLRALGVLGNKKIPEEYLLASERQRRALLAGLVDTDGTVDKSGRTTITGSNFDLMSDVRALVRSLGYRASLLRHAPDTRDRKIKGGEFWGVAWTQLDGKPSGRALRRKTAVKTGVKRRLGIASVEEAAPEPGRCIEVDGGLYLVGESLIPTHNSTLTSMYFPAWVLRLHPDWKIGMVSHGGNFATTWGRGVRRLIEGNPLGVSLAADVTSASEWETTEKGGMLSRGINGDITGRGFKVLVMDDVVKGFVEAQSEVSRESVWQKWIADFYTRLEPPYLVVALGTRWHEDDFIGRLASSEYEGDSAEWEIIEFPAIAEANDILGRKEGEPLLSPLLVETPAQALTRWNGIQRAVGSYNWAALYQQRPAPAGGAIFDIGWWRYWTDDPTKADRLPNGEFDPNGKVVYFDPIDHPYARWLDSWDMAFKATDSSDYVVGQRWCHQGAQRFLIHQTRARMTFTQTLQKMLLWCDSSKDFSQGGAPYTSYVHERLVEDKANGTAIIDTLRNRISALLPVNPTESKEARARAVTPEVEAGNVFLPLPDVPGNEWVTLALDELRSFPMGAHDDTVDALTQALSRMRNPRRGSITVPGKSRPGSLTLARGRTVRGELGRSALRVLRAPGR